ncbi:basal body-orientation factor 1 isoform X2 [Alligator sinensis]|uniref:Basal body-orientation factor 1 n=1 Tax=Alligator sinensis TaxID=38654 RepID=A0A3Q0GBM2_ALLSI|nr:basal body-orientation factor 1 isoform X2 [Alligator sinensis]
MPKGKGAKRGRAKKGTPGEVKVDRESEADRAKASAALWEARLEVTEISRAEYREAARLLAKNNEDLAWQQRRVEKDTVEVISFLKKQDVEKDKQIDKLKQQLTDLKQQAQEDSEKLIKESMQISNREHQEIVGRLEKKFLEEKQRLERDAEKKIVILAERAHHEAIMQLNSTGRAVFKENVRLHEALAYHLKESEELQKIKEQLEKDKALLLQEKETNDSLVQEKILQITQQKAQIQDLQHKVEKLEIALHHMTREFETEIQKTQHQALVPNQACMVEVNKLQQLLEMKDREMNRVKKLAKNILDERTEVERFFLEALEQVKHEIITSRKRCRQLAQAAYQRKMMAAFAGKEEYPNIRTFKSHLNSTNYMFSNPWEAEKWTDTQLEKVDISELTWEQKEYVLRALFAKINALNQRKGKQVLVPLAPAAVITTAGKRNKTGPENTASSQTFITQQAPLSESTSHATALPDIRMVTAQKRE